MPLLFPGLRLYVTSFPLLAALYTDALVLARGGPFRQRNALHSKPFSARSQWRPRLVHSLFYSRVSLYPSSARFIHSLPSTFSPLQCHGRRNGGSSQGGCPPPPTSHAIITAPPRFLYSSIRSFSHSFIRAAPIHPAALWHAGRAGYSGYSGASLGGHYEDANVKRKF